MRILHVSDLHRRAKWLDWVAKHAPEFSLLVIAGDVLDAFSDEGMLVQAAELQGWLSSLRVPTVVCSGNHDWWQKDPRFPDDADAEAGWLRSLRGKGNVVAGDGDTVTVDGIRVAVAGWDGSIGQIRADILVSHAPPAGCSCAIDGAGRDFGDSNLLHGIVGSMPRLILSGHVHVPAVRWCRGSAINSEATILVPGCDDTSVAPLHWVIETERGLATHSLGEHTSFAPF